MRSLAPLPQGPTLSATAFAGGSSFPPGPIPAEACYLGWQESLAQLAKLVDAEIPD